MTGASYVDYLCWALNHEGDRALLVYLGRRITWRAVRALGGRHLPQPAGPGQSG